MQQSLEDPFTEILDPRRVSFEGRALGESLERFL
jgi:hypothetical protein